MSHTPTCPRVPPALAAELAAHLDTLIDREAAACSSAYLSNRPSLEQLDRWRSAALVVFFGQLEAHMSTPEPARFECELCGERPQLTAQGRAVAAVIAGTCDAAVLDHEGAQ